MLVEIKKNKFYNLVGLTKVELLYSEKTQKNYAVLYYGEKEKKEFIELINEDEFVTVLQNIQANLK